MELFFLDVQQVNPGGFCRTNEWINFDLENKNKL